jgi:hypothetical protein
MPVLNEYIDNSRQHGDIVRYRVRAIDKSGRASAFSQPATIKVGNNENVPDPVNFRLSTGYRAFLLQWDFPECENYAYTEIFRRTNQAGDAGFFGNKIVASVTGTSYKLVDTARAEERTIAGDINAYYCFKIRHVDKYGNRSNFSQALCGEIRKLQPVDVDQSPDRDVVYVKPRLGIPDTDIRMVDPDNPGQYINLQTYAQRVKQKHNSLDLADLSAAQQIVSANERIDGLEAATGQQIDNINDQLATNRTAIQRNNNNLVNGIPGLKENLQENVLNTPERQAILSNLGLTDATVTAQIIGLRPYDNSLDTDINTAINENDQFRLSKKIYDTTKYDLEGVKTSVRTAIQQQSFADYLRSLIDNNYDDYLTSNGYGEASLQDQSDFLLKSKPVEYSGKLAEMIYDNDLQSIYNPAIADAITSKTFRDDISYMYQYNSDFEDYVNTKLQEKQEAIEQLALDTATELEQVRGLIASGDDELRTDLNDTIQLVSEFKQQYLDYKQQQETIDAQQTSLINDNTTRLNAAETAINQLAAKISQAVSSIVVTTPNATQEGTYGIGSNASGMKTIYINIDVNAGGLVNQMNEQFILRDGVSTAVSGQITSYNP